MLLIAQNHFQLILEVGLILLATMIFVINLVPLSLSVVTFLSLFLSGGFTILFGADLAFLVLSFGQHEFTHPFGPIALLAIVTALASLKVMEGSGVDISRLKNIVYVFLIAITVFGGAMHRSFLLLWFIGLFIGYTIISKSFRQKSILTIRRILMFFLAALVAFGLLELVSRILSMEVFSPLLRISRLAQNSLASLKLVIGNTQLIGHDPASSYWSDSTGFADGYISLPMQFILMFGLPFPLFFGLLVTKKDTIDYMLPGIFGYAYDFGYLTFVILLLLVLFTIIIGLLVLREYRLKREKNNKKYLGKEVLLIGSLTGFIAQAIIGLFLFNRTINGMALLTFLFLGSLVLAHVVTIRRDSNEVLSQQI
ncbi:hypothetical protein mru_1635 [Methanobrevibacter ruminantium M1]|uniref:Uncharacterized protein n=1 Tax=Methanobrevibacter ruminantium (strain ATCC 35063 / DSM 1093 / JCM 13430 / OCM 146 / M1) TaxID=634498 RepID=D3E4U1_METRM|nr:hypothetical protein [Methanobrevibacter ruminantium]ADC47485.1 hypothetical protein mru_1635 [Methanobrevibacter ruminantium M1]